MNVDPRIDRILDIVGDDRARDAVRRGGYQPLRIGKISPSIDNPDFVRKMSRCYVEDLIGLYDHGCKDQRELRQVFSKKFKHKVRRASRAVEQLGGYFKMSPKFSDIGQRIEATHRLVPDAVEKRLAAEVALFLCCIFKVNPTKYKRGLLYKMALVLYGDEKARLDRHLAKALGHEKGT